MSHGIVHFVGRAHRHVYIEVVLASVQMRRSRDELSECPVDFSVYFGVAFVNGAAVVMGKKCDRNFGWGKGLESV